MTSQIINNHSGWKQPTPTDINFKQELTAVERSIFREILSLCQNKDTLINFIQAEKHYSVELKRGQCIFKVQSFAKDFEIDRKRIRRGVDIVSKWYSQLDIKAMPYGLVITVINYDDIVKMDSRLDNERTMKGQSKDNERTANKSVKSVKTKESVKRGKRPVKSFDKEAERVLVYFNKVFETHYKSSASWIKNFEHWMQYYTVEEIGTAILAVKQGGWLWKTDETFKFNLSLLFRTNNKAGECDYIGDLLNR